jgi:hypothetical protein
MSNPKYDYSAIAAATGMNPDGVRKVIEAFSPHANEAIEFVKGFHGFMQGAGIKSVPQAIAAYQSQRSTTPLEEFNLAGGTVLALQDALSYNRATEDSLAAATGVLRAVQLYQTASAATNQSLAILSGQKAPATETEMAIALIGERMRQQERSVVSGAFLQLTQGFASPLNISTKDIPLNLLMGGE